MTYSRASKFPTRKSFADAVVEAWMASGIGIEHWVVSLETHLNKDTESNHEEMNLYHYHMALKLKKEGSEFGSVTFWKKNTELKCIFVITITRIIAATSM